MKQQDQQPTENDTELPTKSDSQWWRIGSHNEKKTKQEEPPQSIHSWHPWRQLGVFQLKLAFDALRDLVLSPLSIIATVLDAIEGKQGRDSHFETLLKFGRSTERRINLFNQHQRKSKINTVDSVINKVEEVVSKEFKDGELSAVAKKAIDRSMTTLKAQYQKNTDLSKKNPTDESH